MGIKSGDSSEMERRNNIGTMVDSLIRLYKRKKNLFDVQAGGAAVTGSRIEIGKGSRTENETQMKTEKGTGTAIENRTGVENEGRIVIRIKKGRVNNTGPIKQITGCQCELRTRCTLFTIAHGTRAPGPGGRSNFASFQEERAPDDGSSQSLMGAYVTAHLEK
ncbi:hypothetical protein EVAR_2879_1 [Eumeta japonica]|uniref:Uncharacterized protein n=1 Tax=Eumeta variegata TaxID=151549 RepID=A0A4C1T0U0_EUMVA|nr:hypothetical protein EVAR_2879_1 [Eumeta japonica]